MATISDHKYVGEHIEDSYLYPGTDVATYLCSCGATGNMLFDWDDDELRRRHKVHVRYALNRAYGMPDPRSRARDA